MTTDAQRTALEEANKDPKGLVAQLFSAITQQEKLAGLSTSAEDKMSKSNPNVLDTIVERLEKEGAIDASGKIDEAKAKPILEALEAENKATLDSAIADVNKAAEKDPKLAARISELKQSTEEEMALTSKAEKGSPEYTKEYDARLRGHYQAALEYQGATVEAGNPPRNLSTAEAFAAEAESSKLRLQAAKAAKQQQEDPKKQAGADDKKGDGGKKEGEGKEGGGMMDALGPMLANLLSTPAGALMALFVMMIALTGKLGEGLGSMLGMGGGEKGKEPQFNESRGVIDPKTVAAVGTEQSTKSAGEKREIGGVQTEAFHIDRQLTTQNGAKVDETVHLHIDKGGRVCGVSCDRVINGKLVEGQVRELEHPIQLMQKDGAYVVAGNSRLTAMINQESADLQNQTQEAKGKVLALATQVQPELTRDATLSQGPAGPALEQGLKGDLAQGKGNGQAIAT